MDLLGSILLGWLLMIGGFLFWWVRIHRPSSKHEHLLSPIAVKQETTFAPLTHILAQCRCRDLRTIRTFTVLGHWTLAELGIRDPGIDELERLARLESPSRRAEGNSCP